MNTFSHTTQISNWKKQGLELLIQGFRNKAKTGDPDQHYKDLVKDLYEQIGKLTVERDWLKKKSELFSIK